MSLKSSPARQGVDGDKLGLLLGAKAIAQFLNVTERQIYYWAGKKGPKPFTLFNIGDKIAGRRSTLARDLARLETGEAAR